MNDLQNRFIEYSVEFQKTSVESCMIQHKCDDETIRNMLNEATYNMTVYIMELIDGYSGYSSDRHDIINMVTGERLKEKPYIELHDVLDGKMMN